MRQIAILDAPTNLGLRPPTPTSVPGCAKAPGALRDQHLVERLRARDAGCLTPPRYDPGDWRPGDGVAHAEQIAAYSIRLADRISEILDAGEFPLVLGGDCSVVLGAGVALGRREGRHGLVFVDGHSDFRHPGNASYVGAAAGEDLALVTGRGQPDLTGLEGRRPYFRDADVVVLGIRPQDEYRLELHAAGIAHRAVPELRSDGAARSAQWARNELGACDGYWVHIDVDVLDPAVMPAVDAPDPGGIAYAELELLIAGLVATPRCLGVELTVFDPDYDPDGAYAAEVVEMLVAGLAPVRAGADPGPGRGRPRIPLARTRPGVGGFADFSPAAFVPVAGVEAADEDEDEDEDAAADPAGATAVVDAAVADAADPAGVSVSPDVELPDAGQSLNERSLVESAVPLNEPSTADSPEPVEGPVADAAESPDPPPAPVETPRRLRPRDIAILGGPAPRRVVPPLDLPTQAGPADAPESMPTPAGAVNGSADQSRSGLGRRGPGWLGPGRLAPTEPAVGAAPRPVVDFGPGRLRRRPTTVAGGASTDATDDPQPTSD